MARSIGGRQVRVEAALPELRERLLKGKVERIIGTILAGGEGEFSEAVITSVPEELQLHSSLRRVLRQKWWGKDFSVESVSVYGRETAGSCCGKELISSVELALNGNNKDPDILVYHPSCRHLVMMMAGGRTSNYFPLRAQEIRNLNVFLIGVFFGL